MAESDRLLSLGLTPDWDLALDAAGNLAALSGAERIAQDAATRLRVFSGELLFRAKDGIPYVRGVFAGDDGEGYAALAAARAAETTGAALAAANLTRSRGRVLTGTVRVDREQGETAHG